MPFGIPKKDGGRGCVSAHYALMIGSTAIESFIKSYGINIDKNYKHKVYLVYE